MQILIRMEATGSPVFNSDNNNVEGILVRGETDFVMDQENTCFSSHRCADNDCRGEDCTRVTLVAREIPTDE